MINILYFLAGDEEDLALCIAESTRGRPQRSNLNPDTNVETEESKETEMVRVSRG
jgi:hypothetical protein